MSAAIASTDTAPRHRRNDDSISLRLRTETRPDHDAIEASLEAAVHVHDWTEGPHPELEAEQPKAQALLELVDIERSDHLAVVKAPKGLPLQPLLAAWRAHVKAPSSVSVPISMISMWPDSVRSSSPPTWKVRNSC